MSEGIKKFGFDLIGATLAGDRRHPQTAMRELGFEWSSAEAIPISDAWVFACTKYPETYPNYVIEVSQ